MTNCTTHHKACDCREAMFAEMVEAFENQLGPVDDPKSGWLGPHPSHPDHYQCEFCLAEHEDMLLIEHTEKCPIQNSRAMLAKAKALIARATDQGEMK